MEEQTRLPRQLAYQNIIPKGYPTIYKQWINDPLTGNKTWANNDIIRWNFMNGGNGTFDPYRSYIQITVSVTPTDMPVGLLQIDSSAQSFIHQFVLYSQNRQIQRVTQYDTLLSYLNDIGLNEFLTQNRENQGLGYGLCDSMPLNKSFNSATQTLRKQDNSSSVSVTNSTGMSFPTIGNLYPQQAQYAYNSSIMTASRVCKGHITSSNVCFTGGDWNGGDDDSGWNQNANTTSLSVLGYLNNIRAEYNTNFISNKYPQHTQSVPNYQLSLNSNVANNNITFKFNPQIPYATNVRQQIPSTLYFDHTYTPSNSYVNCSNFGFNSLFSPSFTKGVFQPFISATVPQSMILNGKIARTKFPIFRRKFKIPLVSAVIGCLIDQQSYSLLPLQSLNSLLLQVTLSPYAMFTSGYNDVSQYDDIGINVQQKRCWNIERLQYKLHTYYFADQQVEKYIKTALYRQITFISNSWALGNQYQIAGGTQVNNTYIVGCNSKHLNQIVCLFIANDYQKYSFCRKHYRLSNNIRRYWSKLAVQYWPPQPYKGNGGNPISNNLQDDNSKYLQNIYFTNNYMFGKNILPRINIYNFSINQRPYDPTVNRTFYDPTSQNNQAIQYFGYNFVNADTGMGMPWIHQNRVVGKAAYVIPYSPFVFQQGVLGGIDVSNLSNFQVVFETQSSNTFPRDQTLYIFCRSTITITYSKDGIKTIGR